MCLTRKFNLQKKSLDDLLKSKEVILLFTDFKQLAILESFYFI